MYVNSGEGQLTLRRLGSIPSTVQNFVLGIGEIIMCYYDSRNSQCNNNIDIVFTVF